MGAMCAYGISYLTGSPWLGVLAAGASGALLGAAARRDLRPAAGQRHRRRHRADAVRHRARLLSRQAAHRADRRRILPAIDFGWWSDIPQVRAALQDQRAVPHRRRARAAPASGRSRTTRWGLIVRTAGESADAARAMGYSVNAIRMRATMVGGFLAGVGGSFLSLYYPGSWNEGLSSGQGIMAVALVIFARWNPMLCLVGVAAVRRRRRARAGAAVGRREPGLLPLQCRALRPDACSS